MIVLRFMEVLAPLAPINQNIQYIDRYITTE